jgi:hypothetical protein
MSWIAENLGVEGASGSWVGLAFWTALPRRSSANAGQRSMHGQLGSRVIPRETGAKSKRVCFWTLHDIVTLGLVLAIGAALSWLALWAGHVAGDTLSTTGSVTSADMLRNTSGASHAQALADLWVDAINGDDGDDGLTPTTAFRTIQKAADLAGPGTTVHILPGVYRESVRPAENGTASGRILYVAEGGPGTAIVRGSESASSLTWTQLTADTIGLPPGVDPAGIYYADLSAWALDGPPRFVVELDGDGEVVAQLPVAREPDWQVLTAWKHHEFWWAADGGSDVAGCDPPTDPDPFECDAPWRSSTQLTDRSDDAEPAGIEAGNLTTLGDLTGATLVALDTWQGHWTFWGTIVAHDVPAGRVTVDQPCGGGLGWGSKYYVEGVPYLLDSPGEWWYDEDSGRLYLWPRTAGNPATMDIEISRRDNGFSLENRSYTTLDGLTIEFYGDSAAYLGNTPTEKSYYDTVRNATLRYANYGVYLHQEVLASSPAQNMIYGLTLEDSEIGYMDSMAIYLRDWWENGAAADSFTRSGILDTTIRRNEMHHLGFRSDWGTAVGALFQHAHGLRFEDNHVHDVAHNGIQITRSVIQSPKTYGFEPDEIKTGEILIKDNIFEEACQLATDCGALKIWGEPPDSHVFRDVLITGNVFRDTFGWTYVSEQRGWWSGGPESEVQGMGGFGLYVDYASGIHAYRNIAYNNARHGFMFSGTWRDGDIVYYNNVAANSLIGFRLGGLLQDTHGNVNTQLVNNILVNNEGYGLDLDSRQDDGDLTIDHNLYFGNGWRAYEDGGLRQAGDMAVTWRSVGTEYFQTLADIQANTEWEAQGMEGDPAFWNYDANDHDLFDGSWPDLHLTAASASAMDRGTTALPESLIALLDAFGVTDFRRGQAYDIGRYEGGFALLAGPSPQFVKPGGVAQYALRLDPPDWPQPVSLTVASPSPLLDVSLSSPILAAGEVVTLTATDSHVEPEILPALAYRVPITAAGGGFTETTSIRLFVGGSWVYLPLILPNDLGY